MSRIGVLLKEFDVVLRVKLFYFFFCCLSGTIEFHVVVHSICEDEVIG